MSYTCPNCGRLLSRDVSYIVGRPYIVYKCSCGYNSSEVKNNISDRTEVKLSILATDRTDYEVVF